jgi:hypothetical protein
MCRTVTRGALGATGSMLLLAMGMGTGTAQAAPATTAYEPELGIQNCWVSGATYFGVEGGEVAVWECYDIQKDDQGYKAAAVVRVRSEAGTPAPLTVTVHVEGGEDESSTTETVEFDDLDGWAEVHSPWNRTTGVTYDGYGFVYADGIYNDEPLQLDFMHNGDVWLPAS